MQQVAFELATGWNLISLHTEPIDSSLNTVLSSINGKYDSVWTCDPVTAEWKKYIVGSPSLSNLDELVAGKGYWIEMNKDGILVFQGMQLSAPIA